MTISGGDKPHSIQFERNLHIKFLDIYKLADGFLDLQDIICQNLTNRGIRAGELSEFMVILSANFYKATDSLFSVLRLCDLGFTKDAFTISRKIQEIAITLAFICKDREHYTAMYKNYYWLDRHKNIREILSNLDNTSTPYKKEELERMLQETGLKINEVKSLYPCKKSREIEPKYFYKWSGRSIKQMAKECEIDYWGYIVASKYTHISIEDINTYIDEGDFYPNLDSDDIPLIILNSLLMYHRILEILDTEMKLGLTDSLKYLKERLDNNANRLNAGK